MNKTSLLLLCFLCLTSFSYARDTGGLVINIISHSLENGAGKQVDVSILKENLERWNHQVNLCDYYIVDDIPPADINIFLAQFISKWRHKAKLNWFIPNPEFCELSLDDLKKFDLILCKTKQTEKIFKPICQKTYFLGFTSIDHFKEVKEKNFSKHLHLAGKSRMKGTSRILAAWEEHPELPSLVVIKHSTVMPPVSQINYRIITNRISFEALLDLQNKSGIHLCPSKTEGFGHSIMEGMSTGAVVVTVDAPPMNEFIRDKRCLVRYSSKERVRYATGYSVDVQDLVKKVKELQTLSRKELESIGKRNREEYLRRQELFKDNFDRLMERAQKELSSL